MGVVEEEKYVLRVVLICDLARCYLQRAAQPHHSRGKSAKGWARQLSFSYFLHYVLRSIQSRA